MCVGLGFFLVYAFCSSSSTSSLSFHTYVYTFAPCVCVYFLLRAMLRRIRRLSLSHFYLTRTILSIKIVCMCASARTPSERRGLLKIILNVDILYIIRYTHTKCVPPATSPPDRNQHQNKHSHIEIYFHGFSSSSSLLFFLLPFFIYSSVVIFCCLSCICKNFSFFCSAHYIFTHSLLAFLALILIRVNWKSSMNNDRQIRN